MPSRAEAPDGQVYVVDVEFKFLLFKYDCCLLVAMHGTSQIVSTCVRVRIYFRTSYTTYRSNEMAGYAADDVNLPRFLIIGYSVGRI